jgi:transcriptional regulator with XRE-family HTH domain
MADNMRERSDVSRGLAAQIRAERAASGMTQEQAAKAACMPKMTYRRLETGERVVDVTQLDKLARAFGISMTVLVERAMARTEGADDSAHVPA